MLDDQLKAQLAAYLERVQQPLSWWLLWMTARPVHRCTIC